MSTAAANTSPLGVGGTLTLIRHAQTVANVAHVLQGSTDSPLSPLGESQLECLGDCSLWKQLYEALLRGDCVEIYHSPLGRTSRTAQVVHDAMRRHILTSAEPADAAACGKRLSISARSALQERDFGFRECTRRGFHQNGFPKGIGRGESNDAWMRRVQMEAKWLMSRAELRQLESNTAGKRTLGRGNEGNESKKAKNEGATIGRVESRTSYAFSAPHNFLKSSSSKSTGKQIDEKQEESCMESKPISAWQPLPLHTSSGPTAAALPKPSIASMSQPFPDLAVMPRRHLVVVTHGLFISSFFKLCMPAGNQMSVPFADNTALYTLVRQEIMTGSIGRDEDPLMPATTSTSTSIPAALSELAKRCKLVLQRTNDTSHLHEQARTTRAGRGRLGEPDPKQRSLKDMWKR
ncbi:hypothetical protein IE81DRAFT_95649 [Ceraceosorus guamensis]|uniref:Phosphoglycerate mutase-like protein n=1 Tax=Ceraceosorus guamensis TaxID=1522189 RepID=A0A316W3X1_9BASI|nr:hypothetical protein IE81DRAFT_95649 [Ceraceosorus guamensis]PWN43321.1 hypothetical protein IE81DRAFT_95649 [Ceraceosorus guamensis]